MKIGTKSVLFGAHQFLLHPIMVAVAWWMLYGFPCDPRLWVAFFVHDLGYWGKPNMDGPEGEQHPRLGASIMSALFDWEGLLTWRDFTLYHSRFMCRRHNAAYSRLCVADKLATCITPRWLYLPLANFSGEVHEYMGLRNSPGGPKYGREPINAFEEAAQIKGTQIGWHDSMTSYMRRWVEEHRDGRPDLWTPSAAQK